MRYIQTKHLKPGQTLATDLVLSHNRVMLRRGKALTDKLISKVEILGYQGVYVDDAISRGLNIRDVISPDLKHKTRDELHSLFFNVRNNIPSRINVKMQSVKTQIKNIVDEILLNNNVMINIIDLKTYDDYTYSHSINVAILSTVIGAVLGLNKVSLFELAMGAVLHDMGKMFVDKSILNKPDKLNSDEFEEIKKHSELGFNFLSQNSSITHNSKITILHHHESYDGSGYPNGLSGDDIHLFGRIVCVADVYDALISDRPYRNAMLPSDAIEYIMAGYNTKFDPEIVDALIKKVAPYPIGTCLKLSTGDVAIVVKNKQSSSLRPIVKIIDNSNTREDYIDLANDRSALNIMIEDIVNY